MTATWPSRLAGLRDDVVENLCFFTRLPLGGAPRAPDFRRIGWAAPVAGALVGALGGLGLLAARGLALPPSLAATLAIAIQVLATGALHEDGLADVADGFGGGRDRAAKLAILRDSRIGTYGAAALVLGLLLRVQAMTALIDRSSFFALAALLLSGGVARAGALAPLAWLAPARLEGAGASAAGLGPKSMLAPVLVLLGLAVALGLAELGLARALFASALAIPTVALLMSVARRQIGGQTGDVCGAAAALAEIVTLLALLIGGSSA